MMKTQIQIVRAPWQIPDEATLCKVEIVGDQLSINAGYWPAYVSPLLIPDVVETLDPQDNYVLVERRDGRITILLVDVAYSPSVNLELSDYSVDTLAWRSGEEWIIRELVDEEVENA